MQRWVLFLLVVVGAFSCGGRSPLILRTRNDVVCPGAAQATYVNVPLSLTITGPAWAADLVRWSIASEPTGASAQLGSGMGFTNTFVASAAGVYQVRVERPRDMDGGYDDPTVDGGLPSGESCLMDVNVISRAPRVTCPPDVTTRPLTTAHLTATVVSDRPIDHQTWSVASVPPASSTPVPTPVDQLSTSYTPDVAGDYVLHLSVVDDQHQEGTCNVTVHAISTDDVHVEIFWNAPDHSCEHHTTPGCDPTDVDLHLLHDSRGMWVTNDDCYYGNCARGGVVPWDMGGPNDPHLDIDHVNGFGPENINVTTGGSHSYRVGVHFYSGHGQSTAEVQGLIYCRGASGPVATFGPTTLHDNGTGGPADNDFWIVADVVMTSTGCNVLPITRNGGAWIVPETNAEALNGPAPPP